MLSVRLARPRLRQISHLLHGSRDRFGGMIIYSNQNKNISNFDSILANSMSEWRQIGVRGLWFYVSKNESGWVKSLVKNGFEFHHAKNTTAVLTKWLSDESNGIPEYPSLYLGVGAITINAKNEILVTVAMKLKIF